ncbi:MAG: rod shape-determining protein MreC [Flammeovirgaceae bacterium]
MLGELGIILLVFISAFLLGMATARIKLKSKLEGLSEELDVKNVVIEKLDNDLQIAQMKISQLEKELSGSITQAVYEELKSIHQKELNKIDKWLQEQKTQIKTLHKQLEEADQLRAGDRVLTSGDGGVFPPGLAIGQIAEDPGGR